MRTKVLSMMLLASFGGLMGCNDDDDSDPIITPEVEQPVELGLVATIQNDQRFTTLTSLLQTAELDDALAGGDFTIFAPTNEAFSKLPAELVASLQADKDALANVLTYHVVSGKLPASEVLNSSTIQALNEGSLTVSAKDGSAFINDSKILETDLTTSNGIIHVIDTVLVPQAAPELPETVVNIAVDAGNFTTLVGLLQSTGLDQALLGEGPFTVFAPTDEAFEKIPQETLDSLANDKDALSKILLYHVVPGKLVAGDVLANSTLTSANELELMVSQSDAGAFINDSKILATDLMAKNGVVHVIDTVLLPMAEPEVPNIVELAQGAGIFSTLITALGEAELGDVLAGDGPFTVFAPTDDAFAKIPQDTLNAILADKEQLTEILLYHVVPGKLAAGDVLSTSTLTSANDLELMISQSDAGAFINDSKIIDTDLMASNGIVHVIDTVLIPADKPAPTIVDIAESAGNFKTLVDLLQKSGLDAVLAGEGSFTVFAPTDDAFAKIPAATLEAVANDAELLKKVLLYHVVPQKVLANDVLASTSLNTANDLKLMISLREGQPYINDSRITDTDIVASNGVIHVIDAVLLP